MPQQPSPPPPTADELAKKAAEDLARIRARSAPPTSAPLRFGRRPLQPPMKLFGQTFRSDMTDDEMLAQIEQAHDPGTALDRFVDEWWLQNNPKNLGNAVWNPATGENLITDTIPNMFKAPGIQLQKGIDAFKAGEPVHGMQHSLASIVPLFGPAIGNMVDQFREGNTARGVADFTSLIQAPFLSDLYQTAKGPVRATAARMLKSAADAGTEADAMLNLKRGLGTLSNANRDEALVRATPSHAPAPPPPPPPPPGALVVAGKTPLEQLMGKAHKDPNNPPLPPPGPLGSPPYPGVGTPNTRMAPPPPFEGTPMREPPAAWTQAEDAAAASAAEQLRKGATRHYLATKARPNNAVSGAANIAGMAFRPKPRSAVAQGIYNTTTVPADLVRNAIVSQLAAQPQMRPMLPVASHTQPQVRDPRTGQMVPARIDPVTGKLVPIR